MKLVNKIYVLSVIVLSFGQSAFADEGLGLHLSCYPASSDCIEMKLSGTETVTAKREPEMILTQSEVQEARMTKGQFGEEVLHLTMKSEAAEKFAQITGNNVGKQLVVVAGGKALIAPVIQTAITGGSVMLSTGLNKENNYLESLPWLKQMTEEKEVSEQRLGTLSIASYLALGVLLIGGSVYFAFFRGRRAQS